MPLPRLRPVDAYPVRVDGRDLICLRDLEGILEEPVLVTPRMFLLATMLDGTRDVVDIQAEYARRTGGDILFSWDIQKIIEELDRSGLLLSEQWARRVRALEEEYRALPVRPAYHAGRAYPSEPDRLREDLARYFAGVDRGALEGLRPRGIIAPHIDFGRGGWCYAWAHAALAQSAFDTALVLGVAHNGPETAFILSSKPYQTPLGTPALDQEVAEALRRRVDGVLTHELAHRAEHSIEFQIVFLQHALGGRPFTVVPVLCSHLERWAGQGSPRGIAAVEALVGTVRELMGGGRRIAVVASVDFSHVGPRFGDDVPVDHALAARTSAGDRLVLDAIAGGDAEAAWAAINAGGNPRRIDAASATYAALRILEPARGRLLQYGQAPDPAGGLVSFASLALL